MTTKAMYKYSRLHKLKAIGAAVLLYENSLHFNIIDNLECYINITHILSN